MASQTKEPKQPKKNFSIRFSENQDEELTALEALGLPKAAVVRLCVDRSLPTVKKIVEALKENSLEADEGKIAEVIDRIRARQAKKA